MRSFRFSLKTALLVTTIVALGVALWVSNRSVRPLRSELATARKQLRELQAELGRFPEVDPDSIQAMRVNNPLEDLRRYRVFLPINEKYFMHIAHGHMPVHGLPSPDWFKNPAVEWQVSRGTCESGEFTLDVQMEKVGDEWHLRVSRLTGTRSHSNSTLPGFTAWLDDRRAWQFDTVVGEKVVTCSKNEPLVLFALRRGVVEEPGAHRYSVSSPQGTADGIIIWIDQDSGE